MLMKGPISINFLEKSVMVDSVSYFEHIRQNSPYLLNDSCIFKRVVVPDRVISMGQIELFDI